MAGKPKRRKRAITGPRRSRGRPLLFTPEVGRAITRIVEKNGFVNVAAESVGVSREAVTEWIAKGKAGDPTFTEFYLTTMEARAKFVIARIEALGKNKKDLKSQAWLLERLERSFHLPTKQEISGPDGGAIKTQTTVTLSEDAARLFRESLLGIPKPQGDAT